MKKFIIKKILTAKELSKLGRKILEKVSASTLSRIVAECADSFGEAQEYIVASKCYEEAILKCTTMLGCPSSEILRVLVERGKYHALYAANLEEMDSFCVSKILEISEVNDRLRLKVLTECCLDLAAWGRILHQKNNHLELLLALKNKKAEKLNSNFVSGILARENEEEIAAMIEKGVSPKAWSLLLKIPKWKQKTFERLEKEPLNEWAEEIGEYVFTEGSDSDRRSFMRIFCKKYATEKFTIPYVIVELLVANNENKYLIEYFEVGGLLDQRSYALVTLDNNPKVIKAMKTWPTEKRLVV